MKKLFLFCFCGYLSLYLLFACKMATDRPVGDQTAVEPPMESPMQPSMESPVQPPMGSSYDPLESMEILDALGKVYGTQPNEAGFSLESPGCPEFIEGIYFDQAEVVFQVRGDTASAREVLEKASGSKNFRIEPMEEGQYSQKQLMIVQDELNKKFESLEDGPLRANVTSFGVGLRNIEIRLIVNTPEKRAEFRKKIMDSPAFRFKGPEFPQVDERVGVNDTLGVYLRPEYPVFSVEAPYATFILYNHSGTEITCGEHYSITYEDPEGVWRELPINGMAFDIAYSISPDERRPFTASLYPEVHPNPPGRYRFFYEVRINRNDLVKKTEFREREKSQKLWMMAEFRLSNDEQEWKEIEKTPVPSALRSTLRPSSISETE